MKQALILGCSHALGAEMSLDPELVIPDNWTMPKHWEEYGATNSYPVQIAQALGYTPLNHGISGGSNDAMFRIFCNEVEQLDATDIVIACWTGVARTELFCEYNNRWVTVSHGEAHTLALEANPVILQGVCVPSKIKQHKQYEEYSRQWLLYEGNDHRGRLNKTKNILALNMLAQSQHIPVINIDSFWPVSSQWPNNMNWPVLHTDFLTFCQERQFLKTDWGHYFFSAHQAFAEYVLKHIAN
jgi:hypothetical protein